MRKADVQLLTRPACISLFITTELSQMHECRAAVHAALSLTFLLLFWLAAGHIGFLGRSGVFLFVAILMFRTIANPDVNSTDETTIGNALSQLQKTHAGRACLFILGFFLIVYGTFAVSSKACLCSHDRQRSQQHVLSKHACL